MANSMPEQEARREAELRALANQVGIPGNFRLAAFLLDIKERIAALETKPADKE